MMTFRRLYWILEKGDAAADFSVVGIFTSIQDLSHIGFEHVKQAGSRSIRLSLVQLDRADGTLVSWTSPDFDDVRADLEPFVKSGELDLEQSGALARELGSWAAARSDG